MVHFDYYLFENEADALLAGECKGGWRTVVVVLT